MIRLSRLNGSRFVLNCDLIKFVESTPDTLITLSGNEKLMVRETVDEVIRLTVEYHAQAGRPTGAPPPRAEERLS